MHQKQYQQKSFNWRWFSKAALICCLLIAVGTVVALCPIVNTHFYDLILFHPIKKTDGPWTERSIAGHKYEDVFFTAKNGCKLHGWYFAVPDAKYTFLFNHGNGANLSYRPEELGLLLNTGSNVFTYDYEGYGLSEGKPTMHAVMDDAEAAYNYLAKVKGVPPEQIILFGESLGSAVASHLSSKVDHAGVVLQCPLASVRRSGYELFPAVALYPDFVWPELGRDIINIFEKKHAPLLIVAGTKDPMIPIAHGDDLNRRASEPKQYVRIEGAGHTGDPKLVGAPVYQKSLNDFVTSLESGR